MGQDVVPENIVLICLRSPPATCPEMDIGLVTVIDMPGDYLLTGAVVFAELRGLLRYQVPAK